jgi:hypothetical protein
MGKARRTIKDSFPPVEGLDREKVRETFVVLRKERNAVAGRSLGARAPEERNSSSSSKRLVRRDVRGRFVVAEDGHAPAKGGRRGEVDVKGKGPVPAVAEN